jgi:hypothetical protein
MQPHLAPANGASGRYSEFRDPDQTRILDGIAN